ncbi:hypothetical protein ACIHQR_28350 [Corallococcus coralloides]|uniref:hypothetical protein n=1 Tax=Corallococcus coralloides TaxID=184914 RepID=UPI00384E17B6
MQRGHVLAILAALLVMARADAEPYQLFAVYTSASGKNRDVRIPITAGTMLPDGGEDYRLTSLIVHFKEEDLAATTLTAFSRFEFTLRVGERPAGDPLTVTAEDLERNPGRDISFPGWALEGQRDARQALRIEVRSIYSPGFLCLQEQALVAREGKEVHSRLLAGGQHDGGSPATTTGADGGSDSPVRKLLRARADGPFILYTFCKVLTGEGYIAQSAWEQLVPGTGGRSEDAAPFWFEDLPSTAKGEDVLQRHKQALVKLLADRLNQFPAHFGQASVDAKAKDFENALLYVRDDYPLSILKVGGAVRLEEESSGQVRPLADQLDQKSQVLLSLTHELCLDLPPDGLLKDPWVFQLEVTDAKSPGATKLLRVPLGFRHECSRMLAMSWKDYLDQQVTFRIVFRNPQARDLVVYRHSFHIYNFGLITTFPVVSEIVGAATGASPKDIESSSTIPISFALPMGGDRSSSYAVTFPFLLGVNTRSAPRLAEYIALAPSVSLIAGDANSAPHFAFGIGINLARAFHFGYAWAPDSTSNYVLIGVAIPELLPLLSNLGGGLAGP